MPLQQTGWQFLAFLPDGGTQKNENGHQLQTPHQHQQRQDELADVGENGEVLLRAEHAETGADVADARQRRGERLRKAEVVPADNERSGEPDEDEAHEKHARRGDDPLIDGTALRLDDADVVRMDQAVHLAVQALGQQRDARDLDAAGGRPGARTREHQRRQHDLTRCGPEGEVLRGIAGGADDGDDLKGGVGER